MTAPEPTCDAAHLTLRLHRATPGRALPRGGLAVGPWQATLETQDPHGRMVTVVRQRGQVGALLGTLYDTTLDDALERYRAVGNGFAAQLEGSFALLILDLDAGRVLALTDRVGTRSLYASPADEEVFLSTRPGLPAFTRRPLCVAAVASMLVNGGLPSGLTLFEGVRALTPTELHDVRPDRIHSSPYWTVPFNPAPLGRPAAAHAGELIELMRGAVARRVRASRERPYLSLSGGYDSRGLLSLLYGQHPHLNTYSYALPSSRRGTDMEAAVRLATQYGVPHQQFLAYRGDLPRVIALNARQGHGGVSFCEEIDALQDVTAGHPTDVFTGEQVFELRTHASTSTPEALTRMHLNGAHELKWLEPYVSGPVHAELLASWTREYDALLAQGAQWATGLHQELELMIRQTEPYRFLPWRERFIGQAANIHVPYLDTQILEFIGHLPVDLMSHKTILKVALRQMDPQILRVPLATSQGYEADWSHELRMLDEDQLEVLLGFNSRLDDMIDPLTIRHLIQALPTTVSRGTQLTSSIRQVLGTWRRTSLGRRVLGHPPIRPRLQTLPAVILNLLTLREVLRA
ncbi:hypothetical protein E7T09_09380 [Deinococcus sp. KSM4-11]|uniref:asparagine synthase-related protein n=1 Tax=Deinococcus sp. KSM4-11 TaxID=2568654 RepID=UPI0010A53752|nr:asparagine synthase-related protein [Deinococcus sp. KSM4-11]THF87337.1 hypothetical protein E7T09_09380 [Deinococcus sp. KSM4-11]